MEKQVALLVNMYNTANADDITAGKAWYLVAHTQLRDIAKKYRVSIQVAAGVCSALSPALSWEENIIWTEAVIALAQNKPLPVAGKYKGYGNSLAKAQDIASGKVKPQDAFNFRAAPKTYSFYVNLLDPEYDGAVTIDRHARNAIIGKSSGTAAMTFKQYRETELVYRRAARACGVLPCEFQAIIWIIQRRNSPRYSIAA